ncbi:hypothetical protein HHI36_008059 [Cryptolaemus montrouzieri]|uniref:Uncharacterized protein n=1 Tax=Cryptolaemus montrouzieri TaxID=559131 RepID=A0ABD2MRM6_9CUCU
MHDINQSARINDQEVLGYQNIRLLSIQQLTENNKEGDENIDLLPIQQTAHRRLNMKKTTNTLHYHHILLKKSDWSTDPPAEPPDPGDTDKYSKTDPKIHLTPSLLSQSLNLFYEKSIDNEEYKY